MQLSYDAVFHFGNRSDGSLQIPIKTEDGRIVEASYFTGKDKPKDIFVISTQAGCPLRCQFCELGEETFGRNLTADEIIDQALVLVRNVENSFFSNGKPRKLTFANTGEPLLNPNLPQALWAIELKQSKSTTFFRSRAPNGYEFHPWKFDSYKISTVMPKGLVAKKNFRKLAKTASETGPFRNKIQLQISLVSLDETERNRLTKNCGASFKEIRQAAKFWRKLNPRRKVNLSLIDCALQPTTVQDKLETHFPPELFRLRIRSYIPTQNGKKHELSLGHPQENWDLIKDLRGLGYEVTEDGQATPIEKRFGLAANVTRRRYLEMIK